MRPPLHSKPNHQTPLQSKTFLEDKNKDLESVKGGTFKQFLRQDRTKLALSPINMTSMLHRSK